MTKAVYLFDVNGNFIQKFETTKECADFFGKDREYINCNLKYHSKIRKDGVWYRISRTKEIDKLGGNGRNE